MGTVDPAELALLEETVRRAAGVPTRISGEVVELLPGTLREAARALAARDLARAPAGRVQVSLAAFDRIEAPDLTACTVRVGCEANVGEVDAVLGSSALCLGTLSPRARGLTVRQWLEGPRAGLRVVPGGRLETAALSISVALKGGGLFVSHPAPRSAVGPVLEGAFLGCGGQAGVLVEAQLRALPRAERQETGHAGVERPEDVVSLLREALQQDVPLAEVQVLKKARGWALDIVIATRAFRARRDRAALEALVKRRGELRTMRRVYERDFPFEGEVGWDRLAWAIAEARPLALFRLSRESVVVAAQGPVKGARDLDGAVADLPSAFLSALQPPEAREA